MSCLQSSGEPHHVFHTQQLSKKQDLSFCPPKKTLSHRKPFWHKLFFLYLFADCHLSDHQLHLVGGFNPTRLNIYWGIGVKQKSLKPPASHPSPQDILPKASCSSILIRATSERCEELLWPHSHSQGVGPCAYGNFPRFSRFVFF